MASGLTRTGQYGFRPGFRLVRPSGQYRRPRCQPISRRGRRPAARRQTPPLLPLRPLPLPATNCRLMHIAVSEKSPPIASRTFTHASCRLSTPSTPEDRHSLPPPSSLPPPRPPTPCRPGVGGYRVLIPTLRIDCETDGGSGSGQPS